MKRLPQFAGVSDLRNNHLAVFAQLADGPVVLLNRTQPQGILLSPAQWDTLMDRLEDQEAIIEVLTAELQVERGEMTPESLAEQTFAEWLSGESVPA
jgi:PHD/YefM family antitoxin component YafN of YafNO toxin-antitoxin module